MSRPSCFIALPCDKTLFASFIGRRGKGVRALRDQVPGSYVQLWDGGDTPVVFSADIAHGREGTDVMIPGPKYWIAPGKGKTPFPLSEKSKAKFHVPDIVEEDLSVAYIKIVAPDLESLEKIYKLVWEATLPKQITKRVPLKSISPELPDNYEERGLLALLVGTHGTTIKSIAKNGGESAYIQIKKFNNHDHFYITAPNIPAIKAISTALSTKINTICQQWNEQDTTHESPISYDDETLPAFVTFGQDLDIIDFES